MINFNSLSGKQHTEDDQFFGIANDKSDNEFDETLCFCFYLLHDI